MNLTRVERIALELGAALVTAVLAGTAAFTAGLTVAPQVMGFMNKHPWMFGAGVLAFTAVTEFLLRRRGSGASQTRN